MAYGRSPYGRGTYGRRAVGVTHVIEDEIVFEGVALVEAEVESRLESYEANASLSITSAAGLNLDIGVESPPLGVETVELLRVSHTMKRPALIRGRPIHPKAFAISGSGGSAAGTVFPPAPPPAEPSPPAVDVETLPGFQFRWIASDLEAQVGNFISAWPEHHGIGPDFVSTAPNRPQAVAFSNPHRGISYPVVMRFNWNFVEHMRVDLGSVISQPMTIVVIASLPGALTATLHNHILDGHDDFSHRRLLHVRPHQLQMEARDGAPSVSDGILSGSYRHTERMAIYMGIFNGANSRFRVRDRERTRSVVGNAGGGAHRGFNLGKQKNRHNKFWASNMRVLEVIYFESALNSDHWKVIDRYAFHQYELNKW
jgi:hypothetical protein